MRSRSWLLAAVVAIAVQMSPMLEPVSAQQATGMVISEFRFRGPSSLPTTDPGSNDEYIELYNAGPLAVNVGSWAVWASTNGSPPSVARRTVLPSITIEPGCFFLLVNNNAAGAYTGSVTGDHPYGIGVADNGGIALFNATNAIVDQVGLGTNGAFGEGNRLLPLTGVNQSYERKPGGAAGHGTDTNNNRNDFQVITVANPQNRSEQFCIRSKVLLTHEVQGSGRVSTMIGNDVTVRGVVTARTSNGFFLQTADRDQVDDNRNTSEGLFVAHVSPAAQVGRVLHVTGTVSESDPDDPRRELVTHLRRVTGVSDVGSSAVPAPHQLTSAELDPAGSPDQLERFEGMRVVASLRSVSGTSLDGSFYAVLHDVARPFREPGIEVGSPALPCASDLPCTFESFDGNPERLRVDSDGLENVPAVHLSTGAVLNVSAGGATTGVTGPLDFAMGAYTLLPESRLVPVPDSGMMMSAARAAGPGQYAIASLNLGDPAAMPHATRVAKASLVVRAMLNLPDIIGVQEASTAVLGELATRIDADAVAANLAAPGYTALDGFLVKASRVTASVEFVGGNATFTDPVDGTTTVAAFDRLPVMLHAVVNGGPLMLPQQVTVLNNQFRSLDGAGRNDVDGQRVRAQRQAQAEWHANFVQDRQLNDLDEAIVSLGNFNAHVFNDGYVDVMGTALGSPAAAEQVVLASTDLVSPDLVYLGGGYSSVASGNTQSLDHMLATANLGPQFMGFSHARVNADFPDALRARPDNPGRLSDRDPSVAYFSFPPDVDAPVFGDVSNPEAEATGPEGALVEFPMPTATDNLDPEVVVTCDRASGSLFPVGYTGVVCSAQDVAGNRVSVSFTVTVQDTTAPSLNVPANMVEEAVSPGGRLVTFATSATDTVSGVVAVLCEPASGSLFALGTTGVLCSAQDAAGNPAKASFTVTVQDTIGPVVTVPADINEEASSADGRVITFVASALDAVSGSVGVSCVPASGSTFPIGTTAVECTALDAAKNLGLAHLSVTVTRPIPGRMHGGGSVNEGVKRVAFTFEVGESENFVERGWLSVLSKDGNGRPRPFTGQVQDVSFSDAAGYTAGSALPSGVDTVTFSGVGHWNGLANHRFEVTASDRGEPGVGVDTFSLVVTSPAGVVVESISGVLRGGNINSLRH
jgi:hypothetical protein